MAKRSGPLNQGLKRSRPSTFNPNVIIDAYRTEVDRQRAQELQDQEAELKKVQIESLIEDRKIRQQDREYLNNYRKLQTEKLFEEMYGRKPDVLDPTKFGSVNDIASRAVDELSNTRFGIKKQLMAGEGDPADLKYKLQKIDSSLNKVKLGYDWVKEISDEYVTRLAEGTLSELDKKDYLERIEKFKRGQVSVQLDKDFNPLFVYHDKDGKAEQVDSIQDLINGDVRFTARYDVTTEAKELVKNLEPVDYTDEKGGRYKGLSSESRRILGERVESVLMDGNIVGEVLYQRGLNPERKRTNFTEEEKDRAYEILVKEGLSSVATISEAAKKTTPDAPTGTVEEIEPEVGIIDLPSDGGESGKFIASKAFSPGVSIETATGSSVEAILYDEVSDKFVVRAAGKDDVTSVIAGEVEGDKSTIKSKIAAPEYIDDIITINNIIRQIPHPEENRTFKNVNEFKKYYVEGISSQGAVADEIGTFD